MTKKLNEKEQVDKIQQMAELIEGSWKWRLTYFHMKVLMFIESFLWTLMDITRHHRMKVASKINRNYSNHSE